MLRLLTIEMQELFVSRKSVFELQKVSELVDKRNRKGLLRRVVEIELAVELENERELRGIEVDNSKSLENVTRDLVVMATLLNLAEHHSG